MPTYERTALADLVKSIGRAAVLFGGPTTASDTFRGAAYYEGKYVFDEYGANLPLIHLGVTEGDIELAANEEYNDFVLPEETGPAKHERSVTGEDPVITIPLLVTDAEIRKVVSPTGSGSGGRTLQRAVREFCLALIPEKVLIENGALTTLSYDQVNEWRVGGDSATAAQLADLDNSMWFWRVHFEKALPAYRFGDGGKVIQPIRVQVLQNLTMPDGDMLYTQGRPDQRSEPIYISAT